MFGRDVCWPAAAMYRHLRLAGLLILARMEILVAKSQEFAGFNTTRFDTPSAFIRTVG